ncbi:DUF6528 family protein [Actinomadura namibiensis]|uniref:Uncharacterized protein n=1 Tax=Actinomadura namibiensis TaxID=182080 RepID=A0A7W3QJT9_ACTNM|nr:DUF6528 family protein [Actinomadura namibiensis]MBA8949799.1 hypothetical protein [Actinomadura namibiensis]
MPRRFAPALALAAAVAAFTPAPAHAAPTAPAAPVHAAPVPPTDPLPSTLRTALAAPADRSQGKAVGWVVGGDQGGDRIVVLDAAKRRWDDPAARVWTWRPTAANGFGDVASGFGTISDVRVRRAGGKLYVLSGDSAGYIGAVEFPSGRRLWATHAGGPSNVHAAELLPDGNIAAAASHGGWVRVYAASQGPAAGAYTEFRLKGGHGVLWDPRRRTLWAIGDDHLVELKVGGTAAAPTLAEKRRETLPSHGGHDLAPVHGDRDRLWITTNTGVYQYDKTSRKFRQDFRHAAKVKGLPLVKAVGDHPATGQVLLTRPKRGCATTWCTDTAEFFGKRRWDATRTLPQAQFYKARWFAPAYQ